MCLMVTIIIYRISDQYNIKWIDMIRRRGLDILKELGLTTTQARTYITLCYLSSATTAKRISASSNVARQDIYHTLTQLKQLGLIEIVVIGKPVLYRAIPFMQAITALAEKRKQKTNELISDAKDFVTRYEMIEKVYCEEVNNFFLISKKKQI